MATAAHLPIEDQFEKLVAPQADSRKYEIVYQSVLVIGYWHVAAVYGLYLACTTASCNTLIFQLVALVLGSLGVTAGSHRLWTHKAYKAKMPLQILLMVMNSLVYEFTIITWVRNHRMHHRYSDTDADPHNSTRGFFFSHIGWLLVRKHPEVKKRGKFIDMSDIYANPVLRFQKKYAFPLIGTVCFILPTVIPMYFWGETLNTAWHLSVLRYACNINTSFLVNSAAHMWGTRPYDQDIQPRQNFIVSFFAFGEGFHNYHHCFPWDYRTAELGNNMLNFTTYFINFFAWIGWAYDLKTVPEDQIKSRSRKCGDGKDIWGVKH